MVHAVADTNTAISGLLSSGAPASILRLAYDRRITLWGCTESLGEFRRVIRYPRIERRIAQLYRGVIAFEREYERLVNVVSIDGVEPGVLVPDDRDDEVFIRVAVAAEAAYIITRDPDLRDLERFRTTLIVSPEEFMTAWRAAQQGARSPTARRWRLPWRRRRE
jgi:putative PIN family toxin of toxin-antitoxin system